MSIIANKFVFLISFVVHLICGFAYPLNAVLWINPKPVVIFEGKKTHLARPEGVAFSPNNQWMAIANSASNTVSVYR